MPPAGRRAEIVVSVFVEAEDGYLNVRTPISAKMLEGPDADVGAFLLATIRAGLKQAEQKRHAAIATPRNVPE